MAIYHMEAIRNHMVFTQYHLHHNEMQKEVIHDWMEHFHHILNKYNTVKKKLKAKIAEKKELKSRKEQLIFQAECSSDKDMTNLSKKYDQMNKNLDILDSQDTTLKAKLKKDAAAFREESFLPEPGQYLELLDTRIQIRPDFRDNLIANSKQLLVNIMTITAMTLQPKR